MTTDWPVRYVMTNKAKEKKGKSECEQFFRLHTTNESKSTAPFDKEASKADIWALFGAKFLVFFVNDPPSNTPAL